MVFTCPESLPLTEPGNSVLEASLEVGETGCGRGGREEGCCILVIAQTEAARTDGGRRESMREVEIKREERSIVRESMTGFPHR